MKKKKLISTIYIYILLGLNTLYAQIGINTDNPQKLFHVDAKGNTVAASNILDDMVVDENGNLGLGTIDPKAKLHIKTGGTAATPVRGLRLKDGNETNDYLLTAIDNAGYAIWKKWTPVGVLRGVLGAGVNISTAESNYLDTGGYITLPPGTWLVNAIILLPAISGNTRHAVLIRSTFTDNLSVMAPSSDIQAPAKLISGLIYTNATNALMKGFVLIKNSTNANKTYYYIAGTVAGGLVFDTTLATVGTNTLGENNIVAFGIDE